MNDIMREGRFTWNCSLKFFVDGRPSGTHQHFRAGGGKIASHLQQMISKSSQISIKVVREIPNVEVQKYLKRKKNTWKVKVVARGWQEASWRLCSCRGFPPSRLLSQPQQPTNTNRNSNKYIHKFKQIQIVIEKSKQRFQHIHTYKEEDKWCGWKY